MAITVKKVLEKMEILEAGPINCQEVTCTLDDGVEIARSIAHNYVLNPGDTPDPDYPRLVEAASTFHTAEVVTTFLADRAAKLNLGE